MSLWLNSQSLPLLHVAPMPKWKRQGIFFFSSAVLGALGDRVRSLLFPFPFFPLPLPLACCLAFGSERTGAATSFFGGAAEGALTFGVGSALAGLSVAFSAGDAITTCIWWSGALNPGSWLHGSSLHVSV